MIEESARKIKIIRARLLAAQDRQKKYADRRRRDLSFEVGDHVWIRVSPGRYPTRFSIKGKLAPRYTGPFAVTERIGQTACRLGLPTQLSAVHNVFHVSQLKKYVPDESHKIDWRHLRVEADLTVLERPLWIRETRVRHLQGCDLRYVRVQWSRHTETEATWEDEEEMKKRFPFLFGTTADPLDPDAVRAADNQVFRYLLETSFETVGPQLFSCFICVFI